MPVTTKRDRNRRRHIRLVLYEGIFAEFRLIGIGKRLVRTKPGKVLILNLSPGGLCFATTLVLSRDTEWRVAIRFFLEGLHLEVRGRIRHTSEDHHWYEYGVQMDDNLLMRSFITRALHHRLLRMSPTLSRIHQIYASHLKNQSDAGRQMRLSRREHE